MSEQDNHYNPVLLPFVAAIQDAVPEVGLTYSEIIAIMKIICDFGQVYETDICPLIQLESKRQIGIQ